MKKVHSISKSAKKGKGFYIALAISLIAIGGAALIGVNSAIKKLNSQEDLSPTPIDTEKTDNWTLPDEDTTVNKTESDITASDSKPESEVQTQKGYILPIKGEILNKFSGDEMVKSKTLNDWVMHTGIDIKAEENTPVKAMSSGTVKEVKDDTMWGTTITIDHGNGLISTYSGLKPVPDVKVNQKVNLGEVIGKVGNTAKIELAEDSHIHFSVKKNDNYIDPTSLAK